MNLWTKNKRATGPRLAAVTRLPYTPTTQGQVYPLEADKSILSVLRVEIKEENKLSEIEKINKYINNTRMPAELSDRYRMDPKELLAIVEKCKGNAHAAALLAFTYGKAKGYRAARSEAQRA